MTRNSNNGAEKEGGVNRGYVKFEPTEQAPASSESNSGIKRLRISMPSSAIRGLHRGKEKCDRRKAQCKERDGVERVEVSEDRGLRYICFTSGRSRWSWPAAWSGPCPSGVREALYRVVVVRVQRRHVLGHVRNVRLRALDNGHRGRRDSNRSRDVAEHGEERGSVRILRCSQRQVSQRGDRHEQERDGDGLRTSHDRQRLEVDVRHQVMRIKQLSAQSFRRHPHRRTASARSRESRPTRSAYRALRRHVLT